MLGLDVAAVPAGVLVPHPLEAANGAQRKLMLVEAEATGWIAAGGDAARLQAILASCRRSAPAAPVPGEGAQGRRGAAPLGLGYVPGPMETLPQIYYGDDWRCA